jgi:hypothetical protein
LVKRFLVSLVALGAVLASIAGVEPARAGGSTPDVVFHIGLLFDRAAAGLTISALRGGPLATTS